VRDDEALATATIPERQHLYLERTSRQAPALTTAAHAGDNKSKDIFRAAFYRDTAHPFSTRTFSGKQRLHWANA